MQPLIDADILNWEEFKRGYHISFDGRVYSDWSGRYLKGYRGKNGYHYYTFKDKTREYTHRILAKCYIPNPDNLPHINHIDHDTTNNKLENLEWCDHQQNMKHSYSNPKRNKPKPYKHPNCKLTDKQIVGIFKAEGSQREIARKFNTSARTVFNIKTKGKHKHVIEKEVGGCNH